MPGLGKTLSEIAIGSGRLILDQVVITFWRLAPARTLGESSFDFLDRLSLGHALYGRNLARQPVKRCFVELAFTVGLLGLGIGPEQVTNHLGNRYDVSGVDFCLIFLRSTRPHRALDPGATLQGFQSALHDRRFRKLAHADYRNLRGWNPKRHLVLHEVDDEQLQLVSRDLLLFDGHDLSDTMRRIDDELVGFEPLSLGRLFRGHSLVNSLTLWPVMTGGLGRGNSPASCAPGSLRCPATARRRGLEGLFRLGPMTRLACHC